MSSTHPKILLWVAMLAASLGCAEADSSEPEVASTQPVEYLNAQDILRGLDAIHVNPSFLEVRPGVLEVPSDFDEQIERRLAAAGIRPLTAADLEADPGLPEMQIYPSSSGHDSLAAKGEGRAADACCTANIWISVLEGTALDRDPELHRRLPVWGGGSHESCAAANVAGDELILQIVDEFIEDVRRANAEEVAKS